MRFMTLTPNPGSAGETPLARATREDFARIDAALADPERRALAEVVLHLAACLLGAADDGADEDAPLEETERAALAALGIDTTQTLSDAAFHGSTPVLRGRIRTALMVMTAIPLSEGARRLGVREAHLHQRITAGSLMAIPHPHGEGWLIPAFQLTQTGEVPHLRNLLPAAGRPVSAQAMEYLFRTPHADLGGHTPRDWLLAGQDPAPIESILGGL